MAYFDLRCASRRLSCSPSLYRREAAFEPGLSQGDGPSLSDDAIEQLDQQQCQLEQLDRDVNDIHLCPPFYYGGTARG